MYRTAGKTPHQCGWTIKGASDLTSAFAKPVLMPSCVCYAYKEFVAESVVINRELLYNERDLKMKRE